jgi:Spy/CpxP family protein refolding chaperone
MIRKPMNFGGHPARTQLNKETEMKTRYKITLILTTALLAGASIANAEGGRMERKHVRPGGDVGMHVIQRLGKAMHRLDLSEEQRTAIKGEFKALKESARPLVKQIHEGRGTLRDLTTQIPYDADAVAAITEQQGSLTAEVARMVSGTVATVLGHLDEEQRAELQAMGEQRRAHRKQRHEKVKARRDERRDARQETPPEDN